MLSDVPDTEQTPVWRVPVPVVRELEPSGSAQKHHTVESIV